MLDFIVDFCVEKGINGALIRSFYRDFDERFGADWRSSLNCQTCLDWRSTGGVYSVEDEKIIQIVDDAIRKKYQSEILGNAFGRETLPSSVLQGDNALDTEGLLKVGSKEKIQLSRGNKLLLSNGKATRMFPSLPGVFNSVHDLAVLIVQKQSEWKNVVVRVSPDPFAIQNEKQFAELMQKAVSWGLPFSKEQILMMKKSNELEHYPLGFQSGFRTQFFWELKDQNEPRIQFSCEELPEYTDRNRKFTFENITYYYTRFAHGMVCSKDETFQHIDGHIHIYREDSYKERLCGKLSDHNNNYIKKKIFVIDSVQTDCGGISLRDGFDLLCSYFVWNDMVPEYFNPNK